VSGRYILLWGLQVIVVVATTSCGGTPAHEPDPLPDHDHDGDGWSVQAGDCDDANPDTYPGGAEACDGLDNDCDGLVPDDERDHDQDGFFPCDGRDCDDSDPEVHANAFEHCDGLDNDCDGDVDEDDSFDAATWYRDADGDGFGVAEVSLKSCELPDGYTGDMTDCDDGDATIHPEAVEICGDGIDNDCDGGPSPACGISGDVDLFGADARLIGEITSSDLEITMSDNVPHALSTGDLDGDGVLDVVVTTKYREEGRGLTFVQPGPPAGEVLLEEAPFQILGDTDDSCTGHSVAANGDLDGDGYADLLIGAYRDDLADFHAGAVYVFHGPLSGETSVTEAHVTVQGNHYNGNLAESLAFVPDVDGDGMDEFIAGEPRVGHQADGYGRAYLVHGPVFGDPSIEDIADRMVAVSEDDRFGFSVAPAGDMDGDGVTDLVVGAPYSDVSGADAGMAFLFSGHVAGEVPASDALASLTGEGAEDNAGWAVGPAGDVDGDGFDDVLIGAIDHDGGGYYASGTVYLVHGPVSGTVNLGAAQTRFEGYEAGLHAGRDVAGAGDVNGDGQPDILIGSNHWVDTDGYAWLLYGPFADGDVSLADADARFFIEGCTHCGVGTAVEAAGDLDGDGFDDVLVGAPWAYECRGGAFLLYGGPLL